MAEITEKPIESGSIPGSIEGESSQREKAATEAFLNEHRDRSWQTAAEREEKADKVKEIISPTKELTEPEVHNEAGLPLEVEYKTEAEKAKAIEKLMNSGVNGNDQTEALKALLE